MDAFLVEVEVLLHGGALVGIFFGVLQPLPAGLAAGKLQKVRSNVCAPFSVPYEVILRLFAGACVFVTSSWAALWCSDRRLVWGRGWRHDWGLIDLCAKAVCRSGWK